MNTLNILLMVSGTQIAIIVVGVLLLFGGKKIPELAKGLGSGIKNFKKAVKDDDEEEVAENKKSDEIEDKKAETSSEENKEKTV